jgi:hypothetical protein
MATKSWSRSRPPSSSSFSCRCSDATCEEVIPPLACCWTPSMEPSVACGLLAGHDLPFGMICRHHFEWLDSNEVPALIPIESRLEGG